MSDTASERSRLDIALSLLIRSDRQYVFFPEKEQPGVTKDFRYIAALLFVFLKVEYSYWPFPYSSHKWKQTAHFQKLVEQLPENRQLEILQIVEDLYERLKKIRVHGDEGKTYFLS